MWAQDSFYEKELPYPRVDRDCVERTGIRQTTPSAGAPSDSHVPCTIKNAGQAAPGIVVLTSDSKLQSDFQTWCADMATMNDLEARASANDGSSRENAFRQET
jgi:hypothetical protein